MAKILYSTSQHAASFKGQGVRAIQIDLFAFFRSLARASKMFRRYASLAMDLHWLICPSYRRSGAPLLVKTWIGGNLP